MNQEAKEIDQLIKKLHCRDIPPNLKEQIIREGNIAYVYMMEQINNPNLTDYQVGNMLSILVTTRYTKDPSEVIDKVISFIQDERIKIRSFASYVAIMLLTQAEACQTPSLNLSRELLKPLLQKAISMKLSENVELLVQNFVNEKVSQSYD